jgi:hypothetical protein
MGTLFGSINRVPKSSSSTAHGIACFFGLERRSASPYNGRFRHSQVNLELASLRKIAETLNVRACTIQRRLAGGR